MHFPKGSLVEVASEEEGFTDARYLATVIKSPAFLTSSSSKKRFLKALVEYTTLLEAEGSKKLLRENVDPSFLRPCPPEPEESCNVYELGEIVDAFHEDGWWCGIVNAVLAQSSFSVLFRDPPDQLIFKASLLRPHLDWIGSKWIRLEKKEITEFIFNVGASVEVTPFGENSKSAWVSAIVLQNNGSNDITVGYHQSSMSSAVDESVEGTKDISHIRPRPPALTNQNYCISDKVDAIFDSYWHTGKITRVLPGRRYMVLFDHHNVENEYIYSDLRPQLEWKEGKWYSGQSLLSTSHYHGKAMNGCQNSESETSPSSVFTRIQKKLNGDAIRPSKKLKKGNVAGSVSGQPSLISPKVENNNKHLEAVANETQEKKRKHYRTRGGLQNQNVKCLQDSRTERSAEKDVKKNDEICIADLLCQSIMTSKKVFTKNSVLSPDGIHRRRSEQSFTRKNIGRVWGKIGRGRGGEIGKGRERGGGRRPSMSVPSMRSSKRSKRGDTGRVESGKPKSSRITKKELIDPLDPPSEIFSEIFDSGSVPKNQTDPSDHLPISKWARSPHKKAKKVKEAMELGDDIVGQTQVVNLPPYNVSEANETMGTRNDIIQMVPPANLPHHSDEIKEIGVDIVGQAPVGNSPCCNDCQVNVIMEVRDNPVEVAPLIGNSCYNASQVIATLEIKDDFVEEVPSIDNAHCNNVSKVNEALEFVCQLNQTPEIGDGLTDNSSLIDSSLCNNVCEVNQTTKVGDGIIGMSLVGNLPDYNLSQMNGTSETGNGMLHCNDVLQVKEAREISDKFVTHDPGVNKAFERPPDDLFSVEKDIEYNLVMKNRPSVEEVGECVGFIKRSCIWEEIEAMDAFQRVPQNPHFHPLMKHQEELREGLAIGKMLAFAGLFEASAKLCVDDPITIFHSILVDVDGLERHGFDVDGMKRRLHELVVLKTRHERAVDERERVEAKMRDRRILDEINEIERQLNEIEGELTKAWAVKAAQEYELDVLLSDMNGIVEDMEHLRCKFAARAVL